MAVSSPSVETERAGRQELRPPDRQSETFGSLILEKRRTLVAYANMLTGDRAAADDLVQDTFERALRAREQFRPGSNMTAWLRRILRNLFTDRCRQGTRFISMTNQDFADHLVSEMPPEDPREMDFCEFVTIADVKAALGAIEQTSREIFVLAHVKRQSYQEIAAELGIPVSTVGTRLWRARARIRHVLIRNAPRLSGGVLLAAMVNKGGRA